jgi:hypothetical protein
MQFSGGKIAADLHSPAMKLISHQLPKHCKRLIPLLAAPAAIATVFTSQPAKAVLTFNIFETTGRVVVQASGGLSLPAPIDAGTCSPPNALTSSDASICTGPNSIVNVYTLSGLTSFLGTAADPTPSTFGGIAVGIFGGQGLFGIDQTYIPGSSISSFATYAGQSLASLGFTTTGLIGTWQLQGVLGSAGQIDVVIGAPSVPGPLPLLGAAAAFGWSRRLRRRIATPLITPPQT